MSELCPRCGRDHEKVHREVVKVVRARLSGWMGQEMTRLALEKATQPPPAAPIEGRDPDGT